MIFKRKMYATMLQWKNKRPGKTALLLKGLAVLANLLWWKNSRKGSINPTF